MKIIATLKGCGQIGENLYQDWKRSFILDSSDTIDFMLKTTGANSLDEMNLTEVKTGEEFQEGNPF